MYADEASRKLPTRLLAFLKDFEQVEVQSEGSQVGIEESDSWWHHLTPFEWRQSMTTWHLNDEHRHWTHLVDYETLWVLAFSVVVISSGIFGLFSIAQNDLQALH